MSRYYDITITPQPSGTNTSPTPYVQWTSFTQTGNAPPVNNPGALLVEFDFFSAASENPGYSVVTVYGERLKYLDQTQKFQGMSIVVKAGMQAGLPLANPAQQGTILNGQIIQAFGNWNGTDMKLDFVVSFKEMYSYHKPGNFVLNWPKGSSLAAALTTMLQTAYPTLGTPVIQIGSGYVLSYDCHHAARTFEPMRAFVHSITGAIISPGIWMVIQPSGIIYVYDKSAATGYKQINFNDLIGQPTWIDANQMQFVTVMRGDIQVGSQVKMPVGLTSTPGAVTTVPIGLSATNPSNQTTFQGLFNITSVRFIGNSRDSSGAAWATVFQANPVPSSAVLNG